MARSEALITCASRLRLQPKVDRSLARVSFSDFLMPVPASRIARVISRSLEEVFSRSLSKARFAWAARAGRSLTAGLMFYLSAGLRNISSNISSHRFHGRAAHRFGFSELPRKNDDIFAPRHSL